MSNLTNLDPYLIEYAFMCVPQMYAEEIVSNNRGVYDEIRDDCHTGLDSEKLKYPFVEMPLQLHDVKEAISFLHSHKIPFLVTLQFTEDLFIDQASCINLFSLDHPVSVSSTEKMVSPIRGKLLTGTVEARKKELTVYPDIDFINKYMQQQEVLYKLTNSLDTLSEFVFDRRV